MKTNRILGLALSAAFALTAPILHADEHKKGAEEHEEGAKMKIPETTEGILKEITTHQTELKETIAAKKLADVHHHAFAIRDLAAALPAKAAADKKAAVTATSKNIAKLAGDLDEAGDGSNQAACEAGLKKMDALIKMLTGQFPAK
jgi:hypothetical protein